MSNIRLNEGTITLNHPPTLLIPDLILQQARVRPNALAASCGSDQLTYSKLTTGAWELAAQLRTLGVGPNVSTSNAHLTCCLHNWPSC
jgi:non-ribosomal peptide synthetase component E (peptide arylation enzyme)